ncbi:MAG: U32 family peptidase C-terminal domain-containing protein, partial [Clostridia bacterium]|nr:U32 family peptidase C-terminal domain-containing protein [Clostridia bacterium]
EELLSVSHREYATGYYFSDPRNDANLVSNNGYMKEKAFLAVALDYDEEKGLAKFEQRNKMFLTDNIELLTPGSVGEAICVTEMYNDRLEPIEDTKHPYMTFYMKVDKKIRPGDIIRAK